LFTVNERWFTAMLSPNDLVKSCTSINVASHKVRLLSVSRASIHEELLTLSDADGNMRREAGSPSSERT